MANVDLARRRTVSKDRLHELMAEAAASGRYDLPRREGSDHDTPVDGMTATVMTRLDSFRRDDDGRIVNATDPWFLTEAEIAGRRQALEYVRFLVDRVPGYEQASLVALGTQIGVRETRRVYGDARLTRDDVLAARAFDDAIGLCGAPIEDHHGPGRRHDLAVPAGRRGGRHPLSDARRPRRRQRPRRRALLLRDPRRACLGPVDGPVHGDGPGGRHGRRARPSSAGVDPRDVPIDALRDRLRADGAILELPTAQGGRPMTFVRTVLGDIDPGDLGVTYAHEHLVIDGGRPGPDGARLRSRRRGRHDGRDRRGDREGPRTRSWTRCRAMPAGVP